MLAHAARPLIIAPTSSTPSPSTCSAKTALASCLPNGQENCGRSCCSSGGAWSVFEALNQHQNQKLAPNQTLIKPTQLQNQIQNHKAMIASTSGAAAAAATTGSSVAATTAANAVAVTSTSIMDVCDDERSRLLSNTPPLAPPQTPAEAAALVVVTPSPPTTLPLVHAATTHPSHHNTSTSTNNNLNNNSNNNNNNNAAAVATATDTATSTTTTTTTTTNNNNEAVTGGAAVVGVGVVDVDFDDLSEETATTAGAADSSDLSDKLPRPHTNQKKPKLSKLGTKSVGLKRVSFGSSKGSMVETLVFETPTPLSEHVEPSFGFDTADAATMASAAAAAAAAAQSQSISSSHLPLVNSYGDCAKVNMDDSGIEVQEESERSIVRVSIYQSSQPQQICPPAEYLLTSFSDHLDNTFSSYNYNLDYNAMTTATMQPVGLGPAYDRQQSTDSGWDNPFRPGGDLSREADEIVNMIRGGKPITPTEDRTIGNGSAQHGDDNCNGVAVGESVTKTNISQNQAAAQNGTNSHGGKGSTDATGGGAGAGKAESNNGVTSLAQVSKQVVPGPTSASHVVIDEKKGKKKGCCVVQ